MLTNSIVDQVAEMRLGYLDTHKRQVKLKTCSDVYDYWKSCNKRFYTKAPKDGVEFYIDYIDTGSLIETNNHNKQQHQQQQQQQSANNNSVNNNNDNSKEEEIKSSANNKTNNDNNNKNSRVPIALALHGAPGSYHDFTLLIHYLTKQNVRVIAPNFPDYKATVKTKVLFRHSADEKAAYLRDFLNAINVKTIDLLISHSSAIFPSLLILLNANNEAIVRKQRQQQQQQQQAQQEEQKQQIESYVSNNSGKNDKDGAAADYDDETSKRKLSKKERKRQRRLKVIVKFEEPIEIKAVALFNPAAHRLPKSMKPAWFKCGSVHCYQHKLGRSLFRKLGPAFLTIIGVPVRVDNMDNVMLSATVMRNSRCQRVIKQLEQLSEMKLPTLLVFSENDKLIEKEIFYEMTKFLNLDEKKFDLYDNDGDLEVSQSNSDDWCRVMVFKEGGHYAYSNYAKTVNKAVSELLNRVI